MMVGVLLAAGASTRMGRPKALLARGRESWIAHGIRNLWSACDDVVVVLGAGAPGIRVRTVEEFERMVGKGSFARELKAAHRHHADRLEVRFVVNRAWRRGMLSSARAGLRAALRQGPAAVVILPVDHPALRRATVLDLATVMAQALHADHTQKRARRGPARAGFSYALVPRFRRRRGHPVVLSAALARAVAADAGAGDLSDAIRRNARLVGYLDVKDLGVTRNVNRPGE